MEGRGRGIVRDYGTAKRKRERRNKIPSVVGELDGKVCSLERAREQL